MQTQITQSMIDSLKATRPWTRFLGVLGFVMSGLMVLVAVGMFVFSLFSPFGRGPMTGGFMGLLYLLMTVFYIFPSWFLIKYSSSVKGYLTTQNPVELEAALNYQKSFWRFAGILTLAMMVIWVVAMASAFIIPMLMRFPGT